MIYFGIISLKDEGFLMKLYRIIIGNFFNIGSSNELGSPNLKLKLRSICNEIEICFVFYNNVNDSVNVTNVNMAMLLLHILNYYLGHITNYSVSHAMFYFHQN